MGMGSRVQGQQKLTIVVLIENFDEVPKTDVRTGAFRSTLDRMKPRWHDVRTYNRKVSSF